MDWLSWLSKTGLETGVVYEYSLALSRNELQYEDTAYFNHEFLQSMGITVAKHRLEILKLANKENNNNNNININNNNSNNNGILSSQRSLSRLFIAIGKSTKKSIGKYFGKFVLFHDNHQDTYDHHHQDHHHQKEFGREHWKGALLRKQKSGVGGGGDEDGPELKSRALALSGPLDSRVHERLMAGNGKSLKLSGPLDGKIHERLMYPNRSPRLTGPGGPRSVHGRAPGHERLMITTTRNPRLSGPLDGRVHDRVLVATTNSPKMSGPLDGRALSPRFGGPFEKEKVNVVEYDDHSLWTALFHDMKPT